MKAKEIMSTGVKWVAPETGIDEIARAMRDENVGSIPVAENDKLIGIVTDRDLVVRGLADGTDIAALRARKLMSPKLLYCNEDESVEDVLQNMSDNCVRRMPVMSSDKRLVGMVSLGDLSKAADGKAGATLRSISQAQASAS